MILKEVGLELEMFLLDKSNNILEPMLFGFPSDEMGFLIEIRTHHSNTGKSVLESLRKNIEWNVTKAKKLGFKVDIVSHMKITQDFQDFISKKYRHDTFADQTRNLYGLKGSHHTGLHGNFATAGMHVHFSAREINGIEAKVVKLPVEDIVRKMDEEFKPLITESQRLLGEYELKSHGFEYRSLPNTAFPDKVVGTALSILEEI